MIVNSRNLPVERIAGLSLSLNGRKIDLDSLEICDIAPHTYPNGKVVSLAYVDAACFANGRALDEIEVQLLADSAEFKAIVAALWAGLESEFSEAAWDRFVDGYYSDPANIKVK